MSTNEEDGPSVGLFVTCLVDLFRPRIGFAAVKLLEDAGCRVEVPEQSCCGQPALNSGDRADARAVARQAIETFETYDYVVAPSGACAAQMRLRYPQLFAGDAAMARRAERFAAKVFELTSFLADVLGIASIAASFEGAITYHDACSGRRELGIVNQPRRLLGGMRGLTLSELPHPAVCCGFGGRSCGNLDGPAAVIESAEVTATAAGTLLSGDLGCLLNIAGRLRREGSPVRARHVAEVLAGMADGPAIGERS